MFLYKIHLNLRNKEARRDIANPYEMHSTLTRAFSFSEKKCSSGAFLWRFESKANLDEILIVQSHVIPDWSKIPVDWFADKPTVLSNEVLGFNIASLSKGMYLKYRLRANPSVCRNRKRIGLYNFKDQENWLLCQYEKKGMTPITIFRLQDEMLIGRKRSNDTIKVFSVLYDGVLQITDKVLFTEAISKGIGHGKAMGLGLLSVMPM